MKRLILELSLKPFHDTSEKGIRAVCSGIIRQWQALLYDAEAISFLLWTADGSEILEYNNRLDDEIQWAKWIGIANGPWAEKPPFNLHNTRTPYCEAPAKITYRTLQTIVRILKEETARQTGKSVTLGSTFDPGPEFAESPFKYTRHKEISGGDTMGEGKWVNCAAVLKGEKHPYAGFPDGIPDNTTMGTFLGRQSQHFLADMGFDYLWLSNGFGFALAAWNVTGEVFDGKTYDTQNAPFVSKKILKFWNDFRKECPSFPVETRGSNLSTGMDLSAHASPVREIYRGGFNIVAPVNSPWAALNGDYGLELIGWLSHIAELPTGDGGVPFRYYIHDPWWANSPWLDRYGREPNDIYLPLAACRIDNNGVASKPASISFLSIDDCWGRMPSVVPNEVIPHIQRALHDFPDAPGLITWVYPFDEYHEWTLGKEDRVGEVFFGDWFIRSAVNQGFPLNTVITTPNFLSSRQKKPALFDDTILVCPAPDSGTPLVEALIEHMKRGGKVLLYGPLHHTDQRILSLLNLSIAEPISGEVQLHTTLAPDTISRGAFPNKMRLRELTSGGGAEEQALPNAAIETLAEVEKSGQKRTFAVYGKHSSGGQVAWLRGAFCEEVTKDNSLPIKDNPAEWYCADRLMRLILEKFGYTIRFSKPELQTIDPLILAARTRNGWFFSGFTPSTSVELKWRFPEGIPIPIGCDIAIQNNLGSMKLSRAWHRECRVFVDQKEASEVTCREQYVGAIGVTRRLLVTGLKNATVTFLHDSSALDKPVRFQETGCYLGFGNNIPCKHITNDRTVAHNVTGELLISW